MHQTTPRSAAYPPDLLATLAELSTEAVNPDLADLDTHSTTDLVQSMIDGDRVVPDAIESCREQISAAVDAIAGRLRSGGRLIYLGAGTAGRLGVLDASEIPPTFGTEPALVRALIAGGDRAVAAAVEGAEDDRTAGREDLRRIGVTRADAVVGITASGRTPYVLAGLTYARAAGALTIGLSNNPRSEAGRAADIAIDVVVGPEFITGSTRLRSGTAQKMVLNMISTLTMVRLGKTYGNLMVDLQATNDKLRARAERTVSSAAGVEPLTAATTLRAAGGSVKVAIAMLATGLDAPASQSLLERHDGHLRSAVVAAGTTGHTGRAAGRTGA